MALPEWIIIMNDLIEKEKERRRNELPEWIKILRDAMEKENIPFFK